MGYIGIDRELEYGGLMGLKSLFASINLGIGGGGGGLAGEDGLGGNVFDRLGINWPIIC